MKDISRETPTAVASDAEAAESAGQLLKQERLRQNQTLKEVAEATCIHVNTIEAIEEDRRDKLPAEVFVRGFISIYAQHLGVDPQEVLNRYGSRTAAEWVSPGTEFEKRKVLPTKAPSRPAVTGRRRLVLYLVLAAAALLAAWGYRQVFFPPPPAGRTAATTAQAVPPSESTAAGPETERAIGRPAQSRPAAVAESTPENKEAAPLPARPAPEQAATPAAAPPQTPPAAAAPQTQTPPAAASPQSVPAATAAGPAAAPAHNPAYVLEAKFTETTWLRIRLDDQKPKEYLFQPGEHHTWKADTIELFLGNAGGVDLTLNGKAQPSPGLSGKPVHLRFPAGST